MDGPGLLHVGILAPVGNEWSSESGFDESCVCTEVPELDVAHEEPT